MDEILIKNPLSFIEKEPLLPFSQINKLVGRQYRSKSLQVNYGHKDKYIYCYYRNTVDI